MARAKSGNSARTAQIERRRKIRAAEADLDRARIQSQTAKTKLSVARDNVKRIKGGK